MIARTSSFYIVSSAAMLLVVLSAGFLLGTLRVKFVPYFYLQIWIASHMSFGALTKTSAFHNIMYVTGTKTARITQTKLDVVSQQFRELWFSLICDGQP